MNSRRMLIALVLLLCGTAHSSASGFLGFYGIVEKVIFEPNEQEPERVQVWGAFAYVDGSAGQSLTVSTAKKGYLYFRLQRADEGAVARWLKIIRTEWNDLKAVAGTGQGVGFGAWMYVGQFGSLRPDAVASQPPYILERGLRTTRTDLRIRPATEKPEGPSIYQTDSGIVKLSEAGSHAEIVKQLRAALR